jgi:hypothetical protein
MGRSSCQKSSIWLARLGINKMVSNVQKVADADTLCLTHEDKLPPPLFILAAPRSFSSVTCAMLAGHPQMYGLPETHLLCDETLAARSKWDRAGYHLEHGLIRAIAELHFGAQTEGNVVKARQWIAARRNLNTDLVFKFFADKVFPRLLVDKSPSLIFRLQALHRILVKFPNARFIHLVRHPRGHGESIIKYLQELSKSQPLPPGHWLLHILSYPPSTAEGEFSAEDGVLDPQNGWYALNRNIFTFLESVPRDHYKRIRGEDLLADPDRVLPELAAWLGLRADEQAVNEMKHPERWPYAHFGPEGARYGSDIFFLKAPELRSRAPIRHSLHGPVSWRADGKGLSPEVKDLAVEFGYE